MGINDIFAYVAFGIMTLIVMIGGMLTVTLRNIFHAAIALMATFVGIAGIYFMLEAEFIATVQILIYIGAISVLILFAVMLTRGLMREKESGQNRQWVGAVLVAGLMLAGGWAAVLLHPWATTQAKIAADLIPAIGTQMLTTYLLPFEVVSVLLLAALVGAIVIARE